MSSRPGEDVANVPKDSATKITTKNVHTLSTYDLRQELVRRKCLDLSEDNINHNSMLQRLITELVLDESKAVEQRTQQVVDIADAERNAAKALRDARKAEALARSKARQADPNYFEARLSANVKPTIPITSADSTIEDSAVFDQEPEPLDPFRVSKNKGRAKIAGFI